MIYQGVYCYRHLVHAAALALNSEKPGAFIYHLARYEAFIEDRPVLELD
jgi:hypothetical protein